MQLAKKIKNILSGLLLIADIVIIWIIMALCIDDYLLILIQSLLPVLMMVLNRTKIKPWVIAVSGAGLVFSVISLFVHRTLDYRFWLMVSILSHTLLFNNIAFEEKAYYKLQLFLFLAFSLLVFCFYPEYVGEDVPYYRNVFQTISINPNIYGVYVVLATIEGVGFVALTQRANWLKNLLSYLIIAIGVGLILYSKSRTCLLAILIYTVLFSVKNLRLFQNRKVLLVLSKVAICGSLFLTVFYIILSRILPANLVIVGKSLFSGREEIWLSAYREFKTSWLFGFAHQIPWHNKVMHTHNGLLEIWCYFGIVPMLAVLLLLVHNLKDPSFQINLPVFLGMLVISINIAFENIFIASYFNMVPLILLLFRSKAPTKSDPSTQNDVFEAQDGQEQKKTVSAEEK